MTISTRGPITNLLHTCTRVTKKEHPLLKQCGHEVLLLGTFGNTFQGNADEFTVTTPANTHSRYTHDHVSDNVNKTKEIYLL